MSRTLEKACELIVDAGRAGARLIVFPAAFISGYPVWVWSIPPEEKALLNELYAQLLTNAVSVPSETTDRLCRMAQRARINVVMGLNERGPERSRTTCYNTLLYIKEYAAGRNRDSEEKCSHSGPQKGEKKLFYPQKSLRKQEKQNKGFCEAGFPERTGTNAGRNRKVEVCSVYHKKRLQNVS